MLYHFNDSVEVIITFSLHHSTSGGSETREEGNAFNIHVLKMEMNVVIVTIYYGKGQIGPEVD